MILLLSLVPGTAGTALPVEPAARIRIDGEFIQIRYGQYPVSMGGRTLVPLRDVMTSLGFAVEWCQLTDSALLTKPGFDVVAPIGGDTMTVNGNTVYLDVPSIVINNRTLVPLRAIAEATGMRVHWIEEAQIADIRTDGYSGPGIGRHHIDWQFAVYSQPDFRAERVATFYPQTITVFYENADGWALIGTYWGRYWTYLPANMRFIERTMGLFENRGDARHVSALHPQVVRVLEQDGSWLLIATWLGPRWIDLNFTPPTQELDALLRRHGNNISVYFKNLETGFIYRYNADRVYHGASVPKATFSMYIYQKADRGETNLDSRHRFPRGGTLTQREMLRRNLMYSCNDSTFGLRDVHGTAGYRRWVEALGGNPDWVRHGVMGSLLSANEAGMFAMAIYNYIESDAQHSDEFKRHLLNNRFPFIVSDYPIASKTGWTSTVFHDMAIVYADSPYILVILSQRANHRIFADISMAFQRFNDTWFVY